MHVFARVRLIVARHPWTYWSVVAVVAAAVGLSAAQALADIDRTRRSWGEQQAVWTASASIEPGQPIVAEHREVPRAVVPVGAVDRSPIQAVARQRIGPGEIITGTDIAAGGSAALIPDGWVAFAVPGSFEHFVHGDHLEVYSGDQLVSAGLVVDRGEAEVMVAIPTEAASAVAAALLADAVTLALTPGP